MNESNTERPTINDVASLAGVSPASVSRVLNNTGSVSEQMRAKVEAAAHQLGYEQRHAGTEDKPPVAAWSTQTIPLVITDMLNPYFYAIAQGAQEEAEVNNLFMVLVNATPDPPEQRATVERLCQEAVGGVILAAIDIPARDIIALYEAYQTPLVVINLYVPHPNIPSIMLDFKSAAARATQHLIDLGHTDIAFLAGPSTTNPSKDRRVGIESVLHTYGLKLRPAWCPNALASIEGGFQSMTSVLTVTEHRPTAVLAYNDVMAIGAIHAARALGLRVPEDVSIVGFDNIPAAAHTNPPLTTIAPPKYQMGKIAFQALCQLRRGRLAQGGYTLLESSMIIRDSTSPCAIANKNSGE